MLGSSRLGQLVGVRVGSFLGRQIALSACRDDGDDDVERRPFRVTLAERPAAVDLRSWMTPVEEQGSLGSCTSNAVVGALEYLVRRETGRSVDLSRLFVYFNQRIWDDRVREDSGASISSAIRVLHRVGVPTETTWPYDKNLFAVQPPEPVYREAADYRATDWWTVPIDRDALRTCLAAGFPVVFGTRVTDSFVDTPRSGMCGMPRGSLDSRHGRHALLLVGYDDRRRLFIVRNSWGDDWGDRGYVYMPYDYVLNRSWTSSAWAFRTTTRDNFDPHEHGGANLASLPHAPPSGSGSGGARVAGMVAGTGASVAVGALTGSSLLAGLAGGLFAGLTPGVASRIQGRDRGAFFGRDRSEEILELLRGNGAPAPAAARMPWDPDAATAPSAAAIEQPSGVPVRVPVKAASSPVAVAPSRSRNPVATPRSTGAEMDPISALPVGFARRWREVGATAGKLGKPLSKPMTVRDASIVGRVVRFEHGAMFAWDPLPDTVREPPQVLYNDDPAYAYWQQSGALSAPVGLPLRETVMAEDDTVRQLVCSRGQIVSNLDSGTFTVRGNLYTVWLNHGGLTELGCPVGEAHIPRDPTQPESQAFQRGTLHWTPSRGGWRE